MGDADDEVVKELSAWPGTEAQRKLVREWIDQETANGVSGQDILECATRFKWWLVIEAGLWDYYLDDGALAGAGVGPLDLLKALPGEILSETFTNVMFRRIVAGRGRRIDEDTVWMFSHNVDPAIFPNRGLGTEWISDAGLAILLSSSSWWSFASLFRGLSQEQVALVATACVEAGRVNGLSRLVEERSEVEAALSCLEGLDYDRLGRETARRMCFIARDDWDLWGRVLCSSDADVCFSYITGSLIGAAWRDCSTDSRVELTRVCLTRLESLDLDGAEWSKWSAGSVDWLRDLDDGSWQAVLSRWPGMAACVVLEGHSQTSANYVRGRIEATGIDWGRGRAVLVEQGVRSLDDVCETLTALARGEDG